MSTAIITVQEGYILLELPPEALTLQEIEHCMAKTSDLCKKEGVSKVLVWRKIPVRLNVNAQNLPRLSHLLEELSPPNLRVALAFPRDYYEEALDQFSLFAKNRGISMEAFYDINSAQDWLLR